MKRHASTGKLDVSIVLEKIPNDWALISEDFNLIDFLESLFDG